MSLERIGTAVLGATFLGVGYALTHGDCLLIEPTAGLGTDYVACMRRAVVRENSAVSETGKRLYREIVRRGLVDQNGLCHVFPTAGILAGMLLEKNVPTLLDTVPTAIEKTADGFSVEAYGPDGRHTFFCERVLDTTPFGALCGDEAACGGAAAVLSEKCLCASLVTGGENAIDLATDEYVVESGRFAGEGYLRVKLPFDASYSQARERLHTLWERDVCPRLEGTRLGAVASAFSHVFSHEYTEEAHGGTHIASASFPSPLAAFEKGCVER